MIFFSNAVLSVIFNREGYAAAFGFLTLLVFLLGAGGGVNKADLDMFLRFRFTNLSRSARRKVSPVGFAVGMLWGNVDLYRDIFFKSLFSC